ncbi:hypothetical protein QAD02_017971, partial [Eretmocerus hayati]
FPARMIYNTKTYRALWIEQGEKKYLSWRRTIPGTGEQEKIDPETLLERKTGSAYEEATDEKCLYDDYMITFDHCHEMCKKLGPPKPDGAVCMNNVCFCFYNFAAGPYLLTYLTLRVSSTLTNPRNQDLVEASKKDASFDIFSSTSGSLDRNHKTTQYKSAMIWPDQSSKPEVYTVTTSPYQNVQLPTHTPYKSSVLDVAGPSCSTVSDERQGDCPKPKRSRLSDISCFYGDDIITEIRCHLWCKTAGEMIGLDVLGGSCENDKCVCTEKTSSGIKVSKLTSLEKRERTSSREPVGSTDGRILRSILTYGPYCRQRSRSRESQS